MDLDFVYETIVDQLMGKLVALMEDICLAKENQKVKVVLTQG